MSETQSTDNVVVTKLPMGKSGGRIDPKLPKPAKSAKPAPAAKPVASKADAALHARVSRAGNTKGEAVRAIMAAKFSAVDSLGKMPAKIAFVRNVLVAAGSIYAKPEALTDQTISMYISDTTGTIQAIKDAGYWKE